MWVTFAPFEVRMGGFIFYFFFTCRERLTEDVESG